jgi:transposase
MAPQRTLAPQPAPAARLRLADRSVVDPDPRLLDELIGPDHDARLIWALVGELDLDPLYQRIKAVQGHPGRPPIDPKILVALWCYATVEGIASARELERRCYEHDPFKWLRGGVDVNYHTLADFRVGQGVWLQQQVVGIVAALMDEGLVTLNQVGQDGLRVRASAGASSFRRQAKLEEHLQTAQTQWQRLDEEFAGDTAAVTARQQAARRRAARERLQRLEQAKEHLQQIQAAREARKKGDGARARASMTDPQARRMKMPDEGFRPAYNVQFATTLDTLLVAGVDVTNNGTDAGQMCPMVEQIKADLGQAPAEYYTDGGFSTIADIERVSAAGCVVFTPVKEAERQRAAGKDPYAPRSGDSKVIAAWRQRMGTEEAQAKYQQRGTCEWTNAQARAHGLQRLLVRGLEKVKAVASWAALVQNLLRAVALRAAGGAKAQKSE